MKKHFIYIILISIILINIPLILVGNYYLLIKGRIYANITYNVKIPQSEELIDKVESFDYYSNLEFHLDYEPTNISQPRGYWINDEFINYLNETINADTEFHWFPFYSHYFSYSFAAEQVSQIHFTYNDTTIFSSTHTNGTLIFSTWNIAYESYYGIWYINFAEVPLVYKESEKIALTDTILVKMNLYYDHDYGTLGAYTLNMEQYVFLDNDFNIIMVCIPKRQISEA